MIKLFSTLALSLISMTAFTCDNLAGSYGECISEYVSMGNESLVIEVSGESGSIEIKTDLDGEIAVMPEGDSVYMDMPTNLKCNDSGAIVEQMIQPGQSLTFKMYTDSDGNLIYENQYPQGSMTFICKKQ